MKSNATQHKERFMNALIASNIGWTRTDTQTYSWMDNPNARDKQLAHIQIKDGRLLINDYQLRHLPACFREHIVSVRKKNYHNHTKDMTFFDLTTMDVATAVAIGSYLVIWNTKDDEDD